jgi:hypothetical protein
LDFTSLDRLKSTIHRALELLTTANIKDDDDFFNVGGLDSLKVMYLRRIIWASLPSLDKLSASSISTAIVYNNPTIMSLSNCLWELVGNKTEALSLDFRNGYTTVAEALIEKYTASLPICTAATLGGATRASGSGKRVVVLTGSTGSLGSYLLDSLMRSRNVVEVWCLNRSPDAATRQMQLHTSRGLGTEFDFHNVRFRHAILSERHLGLDKSDYDYLAKHATDVFRK